MISLHPTPSLPFVDVSSVLYDIFLCNKRILARRRTVSFPKTIMWYAKFSRKSDELGAVVPSLPAMLRAR